MDEGKRPGGLTALAVFNFIGSALDLLGVVSLVAMVVFAPSLKEMVKEGAEKRAEKRGDSESGLSEDEQRSIAVFEAFERTGYGRLVAYCALEAACAGLLLAAGIGYLKQRRWGRILGHVYAVASVAATFSAIYLLPGVAGGGFKFGALIAFVYPVLTILLLNTTFKEDFYR